MIWLGPEFFDELLVSSWHLRRRLRVSRHRQRRSPMICNWPLLFLVILNNLPSDLYLFCQKLENSTKMEDKNGDVPSIQFNLNRTAEWTHCNHMLLNAAKRQHLDFRIPHAYCVKVLGILDNSSLTPTAEIYTGVS